MVHGAQRTRHVCRDLGPFNMLSRFSDFVRGQIIMDDLILLVVGFCITLLFVGGAIIHGVTHVRKPDSEIDRESGT
jgi:hypothetical protein